MKHKILSFLLLGLVCSIGNTWATDWVLSADNDATVDSKSTWTIDGLTFSFDKEHAGDGSGLLNGYTHFKLSANKTYTLSIPSSVTISNIAIKGYSNDGSTVAHITSIGEIDVSNTDFPVKAKKLEDQATATVNAAISQKGGTVDIVIPNEKQVVVIITITGTSADVTKPTFSMTTPATTTGVAVTNSTVVLTASEAISKVDGVTNVAGTLKVGTADAEAINYVFDSEANTLSYTFAADLDYSTTYAFTVNADQVEDAAGNKNAATSAFSFTTEANVPSAINSVTPDGGAVNGNASVTVDAEGTVYHQWSASSTATIGEGTWDTGAITVPNEAGTKYLHVYAYKTASNKSDITTKTFTITKIAQVLSLSWDFTTSLSATDNTNLTTDSKWSSNSIDGGTRWTGANSDWGTKNTYITLTANDANIEWTDGLQFSRTSDYKGTFFRLDDGQRLQLNGNNGLIKIPSLNAGDIVEVRFASAGGSSSDRKLTANSNATLTSAEGSNVSNINTDFKTPQFTVSADGDVVLTNPDNGLNFIYIKVYQTVPVVEVEISEYEWATFTSSSILDFSKVSGLNAYIVTGHDGTAITKSAVSTVAANTPLLLNGEAGTYNIPIAESGTDYSSSNLLQAGTGAPVSAEDGKTKYVLAAVDDVATFLKIDATPATVPVGKAYLEFNEVIAGAPSALRLTDEENNATSIEAFGSSDEAIKFIENGQLFILKNGITYDLLGRVVR